MVCGKLCSHMCVIIVMSYGEEDKLQFLFTEDVYIKMCQNLPQNY